MADRRQLLKKGAVEFLIIVTGVLAALSVDEYRDAHRQAVIEREYLQRLVADLDDAQTNLARGLAWTKSRARSGRAVLDHLAGVGHLTPTEVILASYEVNLVPASAERRLGRRTTYDELLSTGNLTTIHDSALRDALAQYYEEYSRIGARLDDAPEGWRVWVRRLLPPDVLLEVDASSNPGTTSTPCLATSAPEPGCGGPIPAEVQEAFTRQLRTDAAYARGELNQLVQYQDRQATDLEGFMEATATLRKRLDRP